MSGTRKALHLEHVVFRYYENGKRNILDHVSLDIEEGGITVIMGGSGCGKSTLAAVVAGLYPENGGFLESGVIELFGHTVDRMNQQERAAYLTEMFQNPDLQFCMDTLCGEMQFCMENICVPQPRMDARISAAAQAMGMERFLDRKLQTLSGGEKQRAALCCLFVMESRMILLDEPFANIDAEGAAELVCLIQEMKARGRTVVVIDHQLGVWKNVADEIVILGEGGVVRQRGITKDNLPQYESLFEQEGLFYPGKFGELRLDAKTENPGTESHRIGRIEAVAEEKNPAVTLRGVSISHGNDQKLLQNADAEFPAGCMTAVIGASGSGKTTTFLSILKQHPYRGTIQIGVADIKKISKRALFRQVGIVFQNPANQFITQNVREEILSSLKIWRPELGAADREALGDELLEEYGLKRFWRYSPYMLSQGQQRRLAVLSVLAGGQKILFLDEPTYGQDFRSTTAIMERLRRKVEQEKLTVVFITHDTEMASRWADKIYCLEAQRLVEKKAGKKMEKEAKKKVEEESEKEAEKEADKEADKEAEKKSERGTGR